MAAALRYPLGKLNETSDFLQIGIAKYTPAGFGKTSLTKPVTFNRGTTAANDDVTVGGTVSFAPERGKRENPNTKAKSLLETIILPIPSNIQDGNSVTFGPGNLDGLTAKTLEYAMGLMTPENYKDLSEFVSNGLLRGAVNTFFDQSAIDYFKRGLASSAANMPFGGNLTPSQLLARETGKILNPNMELLFEGVTLRSFKFSFKLTPRGPQEAAAVKDIIRALKKNMTPQIDGIYLNTPNIFELTYKKGSNNHPFLHKFKQCALTDMSVNYTGEGVYATYGGSVKDGGGTPVSMIMDLGFKELEPIYSGDYNNGEGLEGVGY
jgi:hypothetical protein